MLRGVPDVGDETPLDHVGFLSADIEADRANFDLVFPGTVWTMPIMDPLQDVTARFGRTRQGLVYELIQPNSPKSPIASALKGRKNILNHVCYRCPDLAAKATELRACGFFPVSDALPGAAFGGAPIQFFFHPNGLLLEWIEGRASPFDQASA